MKTKAELAEPIMRQYAEENGIPPRSTSDLSPMEQWLLIQIIIRDKTLQELAAAVFDNVDYPENGEIEKVLIKTHPFITK